MSMMVSFCAVLSPQEVLDEILDLTESVFRVFLHHKDPIQTFRSGFALFVNRFNDYMDN